MKNIGKSLIMAVLFMVIVLGTNVMAAAPDLSTKKYMKTYVLSKGNNTPVYMDAAFKKRGTTSPKKQYKAVIYASDEIYVYKMDNKSAYVSYPVSGGKRRYGYIKTSAITSNNYSQDAKKSTGSATTYRRPGSTKYGSVASGDTVYTLASANGYKQIIYNIGKSGAAWKCGWIRDADYNKYIGGGYNPQGCLDSVTSNASGKITVEGWAFDRDNLNSQLKIHVYVGGAAGSGAPGYAITANVQRTDVNKAYPGVGNYHGFASTISVSKTGSQEIYVYAVNVGNGQDTLLGTKTVTIMGESYSTISNGNYKITTALNSLQALDVHNNASDNGTNAQIYQSSDNNQAQIFRIESVGNGWYRVIHNASGKALDVTSGVAASGINVQIYEYNGTAAQLWRFRPAGNGYYYIENKLGYCLDVAGASSANNTNVWVYSANSSDAQKWKLEPVSISQETGYTNTSDGITYAAYQGVDYTKAGLSAARVACLQKAQRMATIQWTSPAKFRTWRSSKGAYNKVKAADGTSSTYFEKGKTYVGIPYSMADHTYDETKWAAYVKSGFTAEDMTCSYSGRENTTAHGVDCSYLTYVCFKAAGTDSKIAYQNTSAMLSSSYYTKKSLSSIKGGDIALKSGHVMLYVGKSGARYAFFEANASDSKVSYNTYTASQLSGYGIYKFKGFSD